MPSRCHHEEELPSPGCIVKRLYRCYKSENAPLFRYPVSRTTCVKSFLKPSFRPEPPGSPASAFARWGGKPRSLIARRSGEISAFRLCFCSISSRQFPYCSVKQVLRNTRNQLPVIVSYHRNVITRAFARLLRNRLLRNRRNSQTWADVSSANLAATDIFSGMPSMRGMNRKQQ